MKGPEPEQKDAQLSALLQVWRAETALPPRFAEGVWRRIESGETVSTSLWQLLTASVQRAFARPAVALVYCTVLIAAGLGLGFKQAHMQSAQADAQLENQYVQAISPYHKLSH